MIVVGTGKRQRVVCINPQCKKNQRLTNKVEGEGEQCSECKKGKMVLRKSVYGQFLGCSNYPKCKHTQKIEKKDTGK